MRVSRADEVWGAHANAGCRSWQQISTDPLLILSWHMADCVRFRHLGTHEHDHNFPFGRWRRWIVTGPDLILKGHSSLFGKRSLVTAASGSLRRSSVRSSSSHQHNHHLPLNQHCLIPRSPSLVLQYTLKVRLSSTTQREDLGSYCAQNQTLQTDNMAPDLNSMPSSPALNTTRGAPSARPPRPNSSSSKQPNILYIMADQLAAPLLKMHDPNSVIKTPNLDKLVANAVVFDQAYCPSPLCAPSRMSMVTGQLPTKIASYDNASSIDPGVPTYAHYLRAAGYETTLAGKMHFIGEQLHGYESRLTSDIYPGDYGWAVNWEEPDRRLEWYHNASSIEQAGTCVRSNQLDYDEEVMYK